MADTAPDLNRFYEAAGFPAPVPQSPIGEDEDTPWDTSAHHNWADESGDDETVVRLREELPLISEFDDIDTARIDVTRLRECSQVTGVLIPSNLLIRLRKMARDCFGFDPLAYSDLGLLRAINQAKRRLGLL